MADLEAEVIAARVRSGELDPVDVVSAHLERVTEWEPQVRAFEVVAERSALREAAALRERDDLGSLPLAGVPVAIKDNVDVVGHPTRHGSQATPATPAERDDPLVDSLRRAGAIVIGKTRMPELAIWPFTESRGREPTRNPWSLGRTPGGSSGGSAVAVATGMAALALGSDGGGSIRIPAASCGVFGVKPAPGLVPLPRGASEHWRGLSAFGSFGRTAADAGLMLDVLCGSDEYRRPPAERGLRISVSARHPVVGAPVARHVRAALDACASALSDAGHSLNSARPPYPPTPQAFVRCWLAGIAEDAEGTELSALEPRTQAMVRRGELLRSRDWAPRVAQYRAAGRLREWLGGRNALLAPILAQDPPPVGRWAKGRWLPTALGVSRWMGYNPPWNVAGCATVAVPVGRSPAGMPIGVQLIGPPRSEARLLGLAAQLEGVKPPGQPRAAEASSRSGDRRRDG